MQTRNQVHDKQDGAGENKRVAASGKRIGELDGQLNPVVVEPATLNSRDAIQGGNIVSREKGGADVADEAADAVDGEDVEGVVDAEQELQLGGVVGEGGAEDAAGDGGPDGDVACDEDSVNKASKGRRKKKGGDKNKTYRIQG